MENVRSAVILAGGRGRRIGSEKAFMEFFGKTLIERAVDLVQEVAQDVVVVARDEEQKAHLQSLVPKSKANLVCDYVPDYGPVAALASGLESAEGEYALAVGCDLPFLNPSLIGELFRLVEGHDAAIPLREDGLLETLHAVYCADRMALACRKAIENDQRRILAPLEGLQVACVPVGELRSLDPRLLSFFNINTGEDLAEARRIWTDLRYIALSDAF